MPRQRLLIGGGSHWSLSIRDRCEFKRYEVRRMLQVAGCLKHIGTQKPRKRLDTETVQLGVGHIATTSYGRTYKQRPGRSLKDRFVELWTHEPACRNPQTLEIWGGLEVSLCTINARGRKLVHILGSPTMISFLENHFFAWLDDQCRIEYHQAVTSNDDHAFYYLYATKPNWRKDLGAAVSLCLKYLEYTGVNEDGNLEALCPTQDEQWYNESTVIPAKSHTWIRLIKDTDVTMTMAIATVTYLDYPWQFDQLLGRSCRVLRSYTSHYSVLETTLVWAGDDRDNPLYDKGKHKDLLGLKMYLKLRGTLKVEHVLAEKQVLVRWEESIEMLKGLRTFLHLDSDSTMYFELMNKESQPYIYAMVLSDEISRLKVPPDTMLLPLTRISNHGKAAKRDLDSALKMKTLSHQAIEPNGPDMTTKSDDVMHGSEQLEESVSYAGKRKAKIGVERDLQPVHSFQVAADSYPTSNFSI